MSDDLILDIVFMIGLVIGMLILRAYQETRANRDCAAAKRRGGDGSKTERHGLPE